MMLRFSLRLPDDVHRRLKALAQKERRSINEQIVRMLETHPDMEAMTMTEATWQERWRRREINRWDAEREAWESYVGNQSVEEFVRYSLDEGITDIDEMARRYVDAIPTMWPEISREELPEDLAELLAGYIRRHLPSR